jgi:8-oxo-dGTP diphosphatase
VVLDRKKYETEEASQFELCSDSEERLDFLNLSKSYNIKHMVPKSKDFPDSFYRVSVKGLYVRDGKILLLKESQKKSGQWELPGGGLDFGENVHAGLKREIEEETGLKVINISDKPLYAWTWRFEGRRNMDWYYSLVLAYRIELKSLEFKPSEECEEVGFFSKEELSGIELCWQTNGLKNFFNPNDFS